MDRAKVRVAKTSLYHEASQKNWILWLVKRGVHQQHGSIGLVGCGAAAHVCAAGATCPVATREPLGRHAATFLGCGYYI